MNEQERCVVCGLPATQYFDGHNAYPMCGRSVCDTSLIDDINELIFAATAEEEQ